MKNPRCSGSYEAWDELAFDLRWAAEQLWALAELVEHREPNLPLPQNADGLSLAAVLVLLGTVLQPKAPGGPPHVPTPPEAV